MSEQKFVELEKWQVDFVHLHTYPSPKRVEGRDTKENATCKTKITTKYVRI